MVCAKRFSTKKCKEVHEHSCTALQSTSSVPPSVSINPPQPAAAANIQHGKGDGAEFKLTSTALNKTATVYELDFDSDDKEELFLRIMDGLNKCGDKLEE